MLLILIHRPLLLLFPLSPLLLTCANVFQVSTPSGNDPVVYAYAYAHVHAYVLAYVLALLLPGAPTPSLADRVFSVFVGHDFVEDSISATRLSIPSFFCTSSFDNLAVSSSATCFLLSISTMIPLLHDIYIDARDMAGQRRCRNAARFGSSTCRTTSSHLPAVSGVSTLVQMAVGRLSEEKPRGARVDAGWRGR
jgi:hypothetical protein